MEVQLQDPSPAVCLSLIALSPLGRDLRRRRSRPFVRPGSDAAEAFPRAESGEYSVRVSVRREIRTHTCADTRLRSSLELVSFFTVHCGLGREDPSGAPRPGQGLGAPFLLHGRRTIQSGPGTRNRTSSRSSTGRSENSSIPRYAGARRYGVMYLLRKTGPLGRNINNKHFVRC